jgi:triosephosphate isomerase (TIM)
MMRMRRPYIVGNWKMHGVAADMPQARLIAVAAGAQAGVDVALCPPATLIASMAGALPDLAIGGQDCHMAASGAYTGNISAAMLADAGASLCIVGHSERREGHSESDAMIKAKAEAALAAGLSVIICVGESLSVRESGAAEAHVLAQVSASLPADFAAFAASGRIAIAYEPIWAIGTGRTATVTDIAVMHGTIRGQLGDVGDAVRLLYGGSVNDGNASEILATADVDGALVGGASLTAAKFVPIINAAAS